MPNTKKAFQLTKFFPLLLIAFSNLLNLAPRGETESRRSLDRLYQKTSSASDSENIARDFSAVGSDIHNALHAYATSLSSRAARMRV